METAQGCIHFFRSAKGKPFESSTSGFRLPLRWAEWCFRGVAHTIGGRHEARIKKSGKMRQERGGGFPLSPGSMYTFTPSKLSIGNRKV